MFYYNPALAVIHGINTSIAVFIFICCFLLVIGKWKVFEKAGEEGWKSLIPFYSSYVLYKIAIGHGTLFLLVFVPVIGAAANVYMLFQLCRDFGESMAFTVLTILFPQIMLIILGFNSDAYSYPDNYFTKEQ